MPHDTPLIGTIVVGLVVAFLLGAIANRFRISPIVGYLLAGVVVGPVTPGFVADQALANELAEIGVILLMFGVGLHFSVTDLLSVRAIAIPGALVQIAFATLLGLGLGLALGWPVGGGVVFGLALSVASTVVLLRALRERRLLDTERGRIAVGWLIVEDIAMVLALVLLPVLAPFFKDGAAAAGPSLLDLATTVGITLGKVAAFFAIMLVVGRRVIPWLLHYIVHTGSRELFRLAVLAIALGVAYGAAQLFGVSFALGAFFAGMILSESPLSQQAANESLPLRDAFAVLFFVAVGMLFRPVIVVAHPWALLGTLSIIIVGKSLAALFIALALRHPLSTALTISASLAQIGEFSFILAALGVELGLLSEEGRDLILAGAIISILINPLLFELLHRAKPWLQGREHPPKPAAPEGGPAPVAEREATTLKDHAVIVGFGRVGSVIGSALRKSAVPFVVIEHDDELAQKLARDGLDVFATNALENEALKAANIAGAKWLLVAIPNGFEGGQIVEQARAANAALTIIARAHSDAEVEHLRNHGADQIVLGEREIAVAMVEYAIS